MSDPFYNPEFDQPSLEDEWESLKPGSNPINDLQDLVPWRPGKDGKGLILKGNKVITWNNVGIHHQEVAQLVGPGSVTDFLDVIEPSGEVGMKHTNEADWAAVRDAGLKPYLLDDEWNFSKVASFDQISWHPGEQGKGLVDQRGGVHIWNDEDYGIHRDYVEAHPDVGEPLSYFYVEPDGSVEVTFAHDDMSEMLKHIISVDPHLHPAKPDWSF